MYDYTRKEIDTYQVPQVDGTTKEVKVTFYVGKDGQEVGMSIRGLAELCGVSPSTLLESSSILNKLASGLVGSSTPNYLKAIAGKVFEAIGEKDTVERDARIVKGEACAAFIRYYASDAQKTNEIASYSLSQFLNKGFKQWVLEVTGSIEKNDSAKLLNMMQEVLTTIKDLQQVATKYTAIRAKTSTHYPGADKFLDDLETETETDQALLAPAEDGSLSLEGWLSKKGITLDKSRFHKLAVMVADNYRGLTKKEPTKRHFKLAKKTKYNVSVYEPIAFPILQMCLNKLFMD